MEERTPHYYETMGEGHSALVRCYECKRLNTTEELFKTGTCKCGHRKMAEIKSLSAWEWFKIRVGIIDFPHRKEFLNEFHRS